MACTSLGLLGIPETLSLPGEQPSLGTGRQDRVINKCKAHQGLDKEALMEAQDGPIIHLFCKTTSYFGDLLTQDKLVQTVMPFITKVIKEIRAISGSFNKIQNTAHVQNVCSA